MADPRLVRLRVELFGAAQLLTAEEDQTELRALVRDVATVLDVLEPGGATAPASPDDRAEASTANTITIPCGVIGCGAASNADHGLPFRCDEHAGAGDLAALDPVCATCRMPFAGAERLVRERDAALAEVERMREEVAMLKRSYATVADAIAASSESPQQLADIARLHRQRADAGDRHQADLSEEVERLRQELAAAMGLLREADHWSSMWPSTAGTLSFRDRIAAFLATVDKEANRG